MNAPQPIPVLELAERPIVDIARSVARQGGVLVYVQHNGELRLCWQQRPERTR